MYIQVITVPELASQARPVGVRAHVLLNGRLDRRLRRNQVTAPKCFLTSFMLLLITRLSPVALPS